MSEIINYKKFDVIKNCKCILSKQTTTSVFSFTATVLVHRLGQGIYLGCWCHSVGIDCCLDVGRSSSFYFLLCRSCGKTLGFLITGRQQHSGLVLVVWWQRQASGKERVAVVQAWDDKLLDEHWGHLPSEDRVNLPDTGRLCRSKLLLPWQLQVTLVCAASRQGSLFGFTSPEETQTQRMSRDIPRKAENSHMTFACTMT